MVSKAQARKDYVRHNLMNIIGGIHTAFGLIIIILQIASAIVSWMYHNNNMFEDFFKPGFWCGPPILILGIICLFQQHLQRPSLHKFIVIDSVIVFMINVSFIAIKSRYWLHDPDASVFEDCASPKWPKAFLLDMAPHCNALRMNNSIGQMMLAFASADVIVCIAGAVVMQRSRYYRQIYQQVHVPVVRGGGGGNGGGILRNGGNGNGNGGTMI